MNSCVREQMIESLIILISHYSPAMSFSFDLKPVDEKPSRKYRKGSKYDPMIDSFLEGKDSARSFI